METLEREGFQGDEVKAVNAHRKSFWGDFLSLVGTGG